jgi:hypothetical protein
MYINNSNIQKENFFKIQRKMIKKQINKNVFVFKLFQDVYTRWDSICHMLIKAFILKKTFSKFHNKNEIEYLKLIDTKWS